ncbi:MAG TPA: ATP-binding protein [Longimicrobiaceae bacterium]|nr:ATP-binding protein [Longimicrobiaceae bacterium]
MRGLPRRRRRPPSHDRQVLRLAFLTGLPGVLLALLLLWTGAHSDKLRWTLTLLLGIAWLGFMVALRERIIRPLQTLSNLLAALREGDFSMRARGAGTDDALGLAFLEANVLADTLREQRIRALEATALLRRVMEEIDVAVFAFDEENRLRLVNRAAERLLGQPAVRLLGRTVAELGLEPVRGNGEGDESPHTIDHAFPGGSGRWEVRRAPFRQGGRPHELLVLADVSRVLREEERQAWQRLIRVLSHEINNSLAPIQSIAGTLQGMLGADPRPGDLDEDLRRGLAVIAGRSQALSRFMSSYARLARLPLPEREPLDVGAWVRRIASLETRLRVRIDPGPEVTIHADGDQLDQLLINLVRNATDAALETGGGVEVGWREDGGRLEVRVDDEGPGLSNTSNLFVPFFTTKPNGTGIGLALSRQIAEGHGGVLTLENREGARGVRARLVLPL